MNQAVNELYLSKCIDYFFMIKKHWPLIIMVNLAKGIQEQITKQFLNSCPKNTAQFSKSLLYAMNFYDESENFNQGPA